MSNLTLTQVIEQIQTCLGPRGLRLVHTFHGSDAAAKHLTPARRELYLALEALKGRVQFYGTESELNKLVAAIPADTTLYTIVHQLVLTGKFDARVAEILNALDAVDWSTAPPRLDIIVLSETQGLSPSEIESSDGVQKLQHPIIQTALQRIATKHKRTWVVQADLGDDTDGPREEHTLQCWAEDEPVHPDKVIFKHGMCAHVLRKR